MFSTTPTSTNGLLDDENFDLRSVGARMLGRDMAKLLTEQTRKTILKHLSESDEEIGGLNMIADIINYHEKGFEEILLKSFRCFGS